LDITDCKDEQKYYPNKNIKEAVAYKKITNYTKFTKKEKISKKVYVRNPKEKTIISLRERKK
jgi:hypothetical protein